MMVNVVAPLTPFRVYHGVRVARERKLTNARNTSIVQAMSQGTDDSITVLDMGSQFVNAQVEQACLDDGQVWIGRDGAG